MTDTIAQLRAAGADVTWRCEECGAAGRADLGRIAAARGPGFALTDRTAPCRTPGCGYWVVFYSRVGSTTRPLRTEAGFWALARRRTAWIAAQARARADPARRGV